MCSTKEILHNSFVLKKAYDAIWDDAAEKYSLTRAEIDVLSFLAGSTDLDTARDIVEYRQIAKSHVSKAVENLTNRGYIRGEHDANDRRIIHLCLTDDAGDAVRDIQSAQCAFAKALLEGCTQEELALFAKVAGRIAENAEKMLNE